MSDPLTDLIAYVHSLQADLIRLQARLDTPNPTPATGLPLLLRPADVAKQLNMSRSRVYELLARGEIPSVRIAGTLRVPTAQLHEWIAKQPRE